jgi:hypothetical protein
MNVGMEESIDQPDAPFTPTQAPKEIFGPSQADHLNLLSHAIVNVTIFNEGFWQKRGKLSYKRYYVSHSAEPLVLYNPIQINSYLWFFLKEHEEVDSSRNG